MFSTRYNEPKYIVQIKSLSSEAAFSWSNKFFDWEVVTPLPHNLAFNSLPNKKNLDYSKLKVLVDDKKNVTQKLNFVVG